MAKFTDLLPLARPELPGCPDFTMETYANRVVREFCARTQIWTDWLEEWTVPDHDTYHPPVFGKKQIVSVPFLWMDGRRLLGNSQDFPGTQDGNDSPDRSNTSFAFFPPDTIRLYFIPSQEKHFFVRVVFQPTTDATEFPDSIFQLYEDGLVAGLKARLMMQAKQDWSNPELSQYYQRVFNSEVDRAKIHKNKQHTSGPLKVKPQSFV